jgi:hypothetical protein
MARMRATKKSTAWYEILGQANSVHKLAWPEKKIKKKLQAASFKQQAA